MIARDVRQALAGWRASLAVSRPGSWGWTALPFLLAALEAERGVTLAVVVGTLAAAGPLSFAIHGSRDAASDRPTADPRATWVAIGVVGAVALLAAAVAAGVASAILLALAGAVAVGAALASSGAVATVVPAVIQGGAAIAGRPAACGLIAIFVALAGLSAGRGVTDVPWLAVLALGSWAGATGALRTLRETRAAHDWLGRVGLLGYPLAAGLVALLGGIGVLAGLGLLLYAIVPALVVATGDATRADLERRGLDRLVGAWLAILLVAHWGLVPADPWTLVIAVLTAFTAYALLNVIATRLATHPRAVPFEPSETVDRDPSLAIVIPWHDDVDLHPATVPAAIAQTYPDATVLVVDARSVPSSGPDLEVWLDAAAVISAPPRPAGWTSADWARHVGVLAAERELVLLVAPDTVPDPIAARLLVEQFVVRDLDLLSATPRPIAPTPVTAITATGPELLDLAFVPTWWSTLTAGKPAPLAVADGSPLLVRRDAYRYSGGLADGPATGGVVAARAPADRGAMGLARAMVRGGYRVGSVHLATHVERVPPPSVGDAVRVTRRITASSAGGIAAAIGLTAIEALGFVGPLVLPILAVANGVPILTLAASLLPLGLVVALRGALVVTHIHPIAGIALHPIGVAVTLVGRVAGIADLVTGRAAIAYHQPS